jgi:hypothetical protein
MRSLVRHSAGGHGREARQCHLSPAPSERAMVARSDTATVKRARFAFTAPPRWSCSPDGSPATGRSSRRKIPGFASPTRAGFALDGGPPRSGHRFCRYRAGARPDGPCTGSTDPTGRSGQCRRAPPGAAVARGERSAPRSRGAKVGARPAPVRRRSAPGRRCGHRSFGARSTLRSARSPPEYSPQEWKRGTPRLAGPRSRRKSGSPRSQTAFLITQRDERRRSALRSGAGPRAVRRGHSLARPRGRSLAGGRGIAGPERASTMHRGDDGDRRPDPDQHVADAEDVGQWH